jgi:hypothetical protein
MSKRFEKAIAEIEAMIERDAAREREIVARIECKWCNNEVEIFQKDSCYTPHGICYECGLQHIMANYLACDKTITTFRLP